MRLHEVALNPDRNFDVTASMMENVRYVCPYWSAIPLYGVVHNRNYTHDPFCLVYIVYDGVARSSYV